MSTSRYYGIYIANTSCIVNMFHPILMPWVLGLTINSIKLSNLRNVKQSFEVSLTMNVFFPLQSSPRSHMTRIATSSVRQLDGIRLKFFRVLFWCVESKSMYGEACIQLHNISLIKTFLLTFWREQINKFSLRYWINQFEKCPQLSSTSYFF